MAGVAGSGNEVHGSKFAKAEQDMLPDCNEKYSGISAGHSSRCMSHTLHFVGPFKKAFNHQLFHMNHPAPMSQR